MQMEKHECSNTTLAKKFKQLDPTIKIGKINTKNKKIEGHLFQLMMSHGKM